MDQPANTYAAIDLGSNSFHMIVARYEHGELRVIDRLKEMVRIAGGLDERGNLDSATRDAALACLSRFGQRIRGIPDDNIRAVGTQTFRRMRRSQAILMLAESALGCPIDIIAGREEARLVYTGVSQAIANAQERNLVVDIGGGSTELVIGQGSEPQLTESLQYGCVGVTQRFFRKGLITEKRWNKARRVIMADLQELAQEYRNTGWNKAVGSSGTLRAALAVCESQGWAESVITPQALAQLRSRLLASSNPEDLALSGVSEDRAPVFAGGIVILDACFQALGIEQMVISDFALREGVLFDLLGRVTETDPREKTVMAFAQRYAVNQIQSERVWQLAEVLFKGLKETWGLNPEHRKMLRWGCQLHEVGLSISHSSYQSHSGYLVAHSDMAGFSRQEQGFLAALVHYHRRKIPGDYAADLPARLHQRLRQLLVCLRLAVALARSRDSAAIPELRVPDGGESRLTLSLDGRWARQHPLTVEDLEQEQKMLKRLGFRLELEYR